MGGWLEISLCVDGELAEAVADVLARFAPNGVMTEQAVKYTGAEDPGTPSGPIMVRAYLPDDDQLEERRQKLEESLYYLGMIQSLPVPSYKQIADQNWMEAWKEHYRPIRIGRRLIILPAWLESTDTDRIPIKIEPGMAFGTGTHPSTQLCLELMEQAFDERRNTDDENSTSVFHPSSVIDVGCGSGILAIAALKLGAETVLGVDIDPESLRNARENARINAIGEELILGAGSVEEIIKGDYSIRQAPLVVANILAPVIVRLLDEGLADLIEERGALILSGILEDQSEFVLDAARTQGLMLVEQRRMGEWLAMRFSRVILNSEH